MAREEDLLLQHPARIARKASLKSTDTSKSDSESESDLVIRLHAALVLDRTLIDTCSKHVKTHGTSFKCFEEGCNVKGFSCFKDLSRHVLTHRRRNGMSNQYFCEFVDCEYSTKGFARRDGLLRHRRKQHASDSN